MKLSQEWLAKLCCESNMLWLGHWLSHSWLPFALCISHARPSIIMTLHQIISLSLVDPKKTSTVIVLVMVTWLIYTTFYFNLLAIWCCASVFCFFGSSSSTLSLCAKIFPRPHTLFNVIHKVCMDMVFGLPCPWPTRTYVRDTRDVLDMAAGMSRPFFIFLFFEK